jgi:hypothetical protein
MVRMPFGVMIARKNAGQTVFGKMWARTGFGGFGDLA